MKRKCTQIEPTCHKRVKIVDIKEIKDTILQIEYGMASRQTLKECKQRYFLYKKYNTYNDLYNLIDIFLNTQNEMEMYRLVYKIDNIILKKNEMK